MPPWVARSDSHDRSQRDDDERALVTRAQAGDRTAFEDLVHRHAGHLFSVVRQLGLSREAAEEVTQEAFLRAWRGLGAFRGQSGFFTWLYRIGVNEAKRRLDREPPRTLVHSLDDDGSIEPADVTYEPHARVADAELRKALTGAIRGLPRRHRAPLVLRDIEGLPTTDAAAILGVSEAAFKSRLHRARAAVRAAVQDHSELGR